jgi:hypothetical protein
MRFRFRSLESRIVTLFLVLIVAVQVLGLLVIQRGIDSNARQAISGELNNGAKVFRRLLEQNAQSLRFGARLLARDTAFVAAIGNNDESDRATIESALANSGRRIKASFSMLVGADRKISVSTNDKQAAALEKLVLGMLDAAEAGDGANGPASLSDRGDAGEGAGHHRLDRDGFPDRPPAGDRYARSQLAAYHRGHLRRQEPVVGGRFDLPGAIGAGLAGAVEGVAAHPRCAVRPDGGNQQIQRPRHSHRPGRRPDRHRGASPLDR